jgi:hypothetical protein
MIRGIWMGIVYSAKPEIAALRVGGRTVHLAIINKCNAFLQIKPMMDELYTIASINEKNGTDFRLPSAEIAAHLVRNLRQNFTPNGDFRLAAFGTKGRIGIEFAEQLLEGVGHIASSSIIAYDKPGKPLGKEIVLCREAGFNVWLKIRMPTYSFQGRSGIALIANDVALDDFRQGKDMWEYCLQVPESRIATVDEFPQGQGSYLPRMGCPVPSGKKPSDKKNAQFFRRNGLEAGAHIGFLAFSTDGKVVAADYGCEFQEKMVLEMPAETVARMKKLGRLEYSDDSPWSEVGGMR